MYYVARLSFVLLVVAACATPKPPEASTAEAPALPDPDAGPATTPAPEPPASPAVAGGSGGSAATPSDAPVIQTLFVREALAECQAEGARQCLQVRSSDQEDWRRFFATIEGFEYEPSYVYELSVAVSPVPDAPADAPSLRYRLLEVVSKRRVGQTSGQ